MSSRKRLRKPARAAAATHSAQPLLTATAAAMSSAPSGTSTPASVCNFCGVVQCRERQCRLYALCALVCFLCPFLCACTFRVVWWLGGLSFCHSVCVSVWVCVRQSRGVRVQQAAPLLQSAPSCGSWSPVPSHGAAFPPPFSSPTSWCVACADCFPRRVRLLTNLPCPHTHTYIHTHSHA